MINLTRRTSRQDDDALSHHLDTLKALDPLDRTVRLYSVGATREEVRAIMLECDNLEDPAYTITPERLAQLADALRVVRPIPPAK
jgi:hypothetical protein